MTAVPDAAPWRPTRVHRLARAVGSAVVISLPVAVIAWAVRAEMSGVVDLDLRAIAAATDITRDNPDLRSALLVWEEALQARWVNLAVAALAVWTWRHHGLRTRALWAIATVGVGWLLANGLKEVVRRARPVVEDAVAHAPGFSFPSGHAMNTAVAGLTVTLLLWPVLGPRARVVVPATAAVLVVLTGADRVFLGAHYPSDVVAGVLLGAAVAVGSYLGYIGWHHDDRITPP